MLHELDSRLTAERLQWLELIDLFGSQEWQRQLPHNAAAHCREIGWTQVRFIASQGKFIHELTDEGANLLGMSRRFKVSAPDLE